ncbi:MULTISPECIES: T9SS type A sorting domain-containing protein [Spirosoma]|uniref:T9SS type A sorting domain-containing protein n=1 Tax=Spirosoma sordidisoli TaxID=2502893 RepID=A0A4Q2UFN1_9BACT|nr:MULTISPECIES: T9SS type A sorting domain-containing protein [Spirosoma]RYC68067.1 T9SS type A sorting domain-containing protein [Spirosoma sordidisoli]
MNRLATTLLLTFLVNLTMAAPLPRRDRPTKLAHYQVGAYVSIRGKLVVNIDKELGGEVSIQLLDQQGNACFNRTMLQTETKTRLQLDLSELASGTYTLKLSNGLDVVIREISVSTPVETPVYRSVTVIP